MSADEAVVKRDDEREGNGASGTVEQAYSVNTRDYLKKPSTGSI